MRARKSHVLAVGDVIRCHGIPCRITKVWPFGTYDVLSLDGERAFRVSGLYGATVVPA